MSILRITTLTLALAAPLAATGAESTDIAEAAAAELRAALAGRDVEALMATYGRGAVVMPPTDETLMDPRSIRAFWESEADHLERFDVDWLRCERTGDTIYTAGVWSAVRTEGAERELTGGNLVTVFTRQPDGSWKTTLQTWN